MAKTLDYFPCYHSYRQKLSMLSYEEKGKLFDTLLAYSAGDTEFVEQMELSEMAKVAFAFIVDDIDRAKRNYQKKCENMSRAAKEREAGKNKNEDNHNCDNCDDCDNCNQTKSKSESKNEDKSKSDISKDIIPLLSPSELETLSGRSPELFKAVESWFTYKAEKNQKYKPTGRKSLITVIKNHCETYGDNAVIETITKSMAGTYQGITWELLDKKRSYQPKQEQAPEQPHSFDLNEFDNWSLNHGVKPR